MLQFLFGLFIILHGLVHLWFVALSQGLVEIQPGMSAVGWTGKSWLFTGVLGDPPTRLLASILLVIATVGFVISGIGIFVRSEWWWTALLGSAVFSAAIILMLWDGHMQLLVEKGLIGFLISLVILLALLFFKPPTAAF